MALTVKQKRKRPTRTPRTRRIASMTTDELRAFVEAMIDRKLANLTRTRIHSRERVVTARVKQRAVSVVGRFHSGRSDISAQHDDYLTAGYRE